MSDADLMAIRQLGRVSFAEIKQKLSAYIDQHPEAITQAPHREAESSLHTTDSVFTTTLPASIPDPPTRLEGLLRQVGCETLREAIALAFFSDQGLREEMRKVVHILVYDHPDLIQWTPLEMLNLSTRAYKVLTRSGIWTIEQLALMPEREIRKIPHVGTTLQAEITEKLRSFLATFLSPGAALDLPKQIEPPLPYDSNLSGAALDSLIEEWLLPLGERHRQVISWRYGLDGKVFTLEEIGLRLGITRERVRQLESKAIYQLRMPQHCFIVQPLVEVIRKALAEAGGICTEVQLGEVLTETIKVERVNPQGVVRLLLSTQDEFAEVRGLQSWGFKRLPLHLCAEIGRIALEILAATYAPLSKEELLDRFKATHWYQEHADQLNDAFILACININGKIVYNDDGHFGLEIWSRRYQDDIILALRKLGRPAHYSEIAAAINATLPKEQQVTPRTVHIRLMQNPDLFVWVGRKGMYGLREWGLEQAPSYEEALIQILEQTGYPLTFQEILTRLSALRPYYEENSVNIVLSTNKRFRSFRDGTYGLAEWQDDRLASEEYRLRRVFGDTNTVPSAPKPRPGLKEAIEKVDDFISLSRRRIAVEH